MHVFRGSFSVSEDLAMFCLRIDSQCLTRYKFAPLVFTFCLFSNSCASEKSAKTKTKLKIDSSGLRHSVECFPKLQNFHSMYYTSCLSFSFKPLILFFPLTGIPPPLSCVSPRLLIAAPSCQTPQHKLKGSSPQKVFSRGENLDLRFEI